MDELERLSLQESVDILEMRRNARRSEDDWESKARTVVSLEHRARVHGIL